MTRIQDPHLVIVVMNKAIYANPRFIGQLKIIVAEVPKRVAPESPLAPQWYRLEDREGKKIMRGDLMFVVWKGNQADQFYSDAWFSNATAVSGNAIANTRPKVYFSPTFWYLRVTVIQAQDLSLRFSPEDAEIFVQANLGNMRLRTSSSKDKNENPNWNEDLIFVVEEPFDVPLVLTIEQGNLDDHVSLGRCKVPVDKVDKRTDPAPLAAKWFNLDRPGIIEFPHEEVKFASKLYLRLTLEGGHHVSDEPLEYTSDFRPSSKKLWRPAIGKLELGILKATGLSPTKMGYHTDMRNRTDAYCLAKYGPKWVRTRTIVDSLSPKWNEQYTWDVYDPCTVITIAVFDNNQLDFPVHRTEAGDGIMGKLRIRLSTLFSLSELISFTPGRPKFFTHSYPLVVLLPTGVKKMGEIQLAVRFTKTSLFEYWQSYLTPMFPRLQFFNPLSQFQLDIVRNQVVLITAWRLGKAEPPLGTEVVYYMLDFKLNTWSLRRGKANLNRVMAFLGDILGLFKFLEQAGFQRRPKHPTFMDVKLSCADTASVEDLEEEYDRFPSDFTDEIVRKRYDRLRAIAQTVETMIGDLATKLERLQNLSSWQDRAATSFYLILCIIGFLVTTLLPLKFVIFLMIVYLLRPPRFRIIMPSILQNFIRRLPSRGPYTLRL
ncbi:C2 domain-containing protein [Quillaja saponaria]|uniref:C2 domain-containing protein n=1 Tax=Quillaja saponaria TaxID=32244 RepID=A0AAD7Q1Y0_QUISA|nr:C2 domain-containing protein [Quillaja saponaria]